jgi:hypothetical protein
MGGIYQHIARLQVALLRTCPQRPHTAATAAAALPHLRQLAGLLDNYLHPSNTGRLVGQPFAYGAGHGSHLMVVHVLKNHCLLACCEIRLTGLLSITSYACCFSGKWCRDLASWVKHLASELLKQLGHQVGSAGGVVWGMEQGCCNGCLLKVVGMAGVGQLSELHSRQPT